MTMFGTGLNKRIRRGPPRRIDHVELDNPDQDNSEIKIDNSNIKI